MRYSGLKVLDKRTVKTEQMKRAVNNKLNLSIDINVHGLDELAKAATTIAVVLADRRHCHKSCEQSASESFADDYREVNESPKEEPETHEETEKKAVTEIVPESNEAQEEQITPNHTISEITAKAIAMMDIDPTVQPKLIDLLHKFGAESLPTLETQYYDSFYDELEVL